MNRPIRFLTLLLCSIAGLWATAQTAWRTLPSDPALSRTLLAASAQKLAVSLKELPSTYKKELTGIYKERFSYVQAQFTEDRLLLHPALHGYLQQLLEVVLTANPELKPLAPRVVFHKSRVPNAVSVGEGTILFHIGLFSRLENEAQAAFVLCHELAHLYLDHGNKSIHQLVATLHSEEFKKQLKNIERSRYGQNSQIEALTKGLTFRSRRHSRAGELEADSLALQFLKRTGWDAREALGALALLEKADEDKHDVDLNLEQQFHFPGF
ncbi:MAG TPA: M48 family metalloprotease, partial [Chitinophagaceae bacterium]|nr:M48 family metalloprotease [Chitinophagaceae bacterium]